MKCRYIIPIFMLFFSCNRDIQNITIQGIVRKADNNEPISGVAVTVVCWKYGNTPDESYSEDEIKVVISDNEGRYQVDFDKGAFVEVMFFLDGYVSEHESRKIYKKKNVINGAVFPQEQNKQEIEK